VAEPTGILVVNKPPEITSHDVVDAVRLLTGTRRVGHTGTLDPMATGVLVLVVGRATRLAQYLEVDPKEYVGEMLLGIETDTYDITGEVKAQRPCTATDEEIVSALMKYTGTFDQVPPMRSAKKVQGQPLYKLARKGIEVEREPKRVQVYELEVSGVDRADGVKVAFRIVCSRGTYVRSICHDVGQDLGCGGVLYRLERTRCGRFSIENAYTLEQLEELKERGELESAIIPPAQALENYNAVVVRQGYVARVANGEPVQLRMVKDTIGERFARGSTIRLLDERGRFLGLARWYGELARRPQDVVAKPFVVMVA
jgi:tRNA pseudouridine55 synthase